MSVFLVCTFLHFPHSDKLGPIFLFGFSLHSGFQERQRRSFFCAHFCAFSPARYRVNKFLDFHSFKSLPGKRHNREDTPFKDRTYFLA